MDKKLQQYLKEFDEKFVPESDNLENGIHWLFRVNDDGTRSIALPEDVKSFLIQTIKADRKAFLEAVMPEEAGIVDVDYWIGWNDALQAIKDNAKEKYGL